MIQAILYDPKTRRLTDGGAALIDRWAQQTDSSIWVALQGEEPEQDARLLAGRFGIHPLAIHDALRDRHPPKIERFADNTFILLKGLDADSTSIDSAPDLSRGALALHLCCIVADRFVPILLATENRLEELETEMIERPSDELLAELVRQKGDLKKVLRVLQYHAQVFTSARSHPPEPLVGHEHELTDDLMTGYLSLSAHKLNQIMQTLTIVTVIFVPITFMAGIYGMNFEHMPELPIRNAYFYLLGAMAVVVSAILGLLYYRGWLGRHGKHRGR